MIFLKQQPILITMENLVESLEAIESFNTTLDDVRILNLPKIHDPRGNLSFVESSKPIPFDIQRVYWIYDVPGGAKRGSHAFKKNREFIIALSGSFDVCLNDGFREQRFSLNRSYYGIYIPRMLWRTIENFSTNSLALILSSTAYDEDDYIRDLETFELQKKHDRSKH